MSDSKAIPSRSKIVVGICRTASFDGGTAGSPDAVLVGDVKTDGRAETLLLPPGYGGADEIGDKLVALLTQVAQVTVCQMVLYVVDWPTDETAPTEELLGVMKTVDSNVLVIVEVVWKVRVEVLLPMT